MTQQEASVTVSVPLAEAEQRLRDVTCWSSFLVGVEDVAKISHERYAFRLDDGRQLRVAVRLHLRNHCFTWHALGGPAFEGSLKLTPVNSMCTRMTLRLVIRPAGFVANLAEMVGTSRSRAAVDLQRLDTYVHAEAS